MARRGWRSRRTEAAEGIVRQHHPDRLILVCMLILMFTGLLIIYAIGPQLANLMNSLLGYQYSQEFFFQKQLISLVLALATFALMAKLPYTWALKYGTKVLWVGFIACALLAVGGWVHLIPATNGAVRWITLGPLGSIQPAEILKFGILLYLAMFLGIRAKEGRINDPRATLLPVAAMTGLALLFVIVIQKDLGTGISVTSIVATMLVVAGINRKVIYQLFGTLLVAGLLVIFTAQHRIDRVLTFLHGDTGSSKTTGTADSYQVDHAKIAIGSGGLFGVGIGDSVQASGYLPEAINDSIFAIVGETFGFVGSVALLALFVALLMRLLTLMDHLVDIRLKLLAAGVFGWMGSHVILNIAAMIGIIPLTGITLPLISYGGTSMIFMTAALGLTYQLSRYTIHGASIKEEDYESSRRGRGVGRTRYASRRSS